MATTFPAKAIEGHVRLVQRLARSLKEHARHDAGPREPRRGKPTGRPWCRRSHPRWPAHPGHHSGPYADLTSPDAHHRVLDELLLAPDEAALHLPVAGGVVGSPVLGLHTVPRDLLQRFGAVLLAEDLEEGLGFDPVEDGEVPDAGSDEAVNVEL